ncbi:MAG: hypothetical protein IH945_00185 [Armatimonadetes bacterium]|nr:hypothetical protein [Armatimonadota bacterium]
MFSAILLVVASWGGASFPSATGAVVFDKTANELYEYAIAEYQRLQIGARTVVAEQVVNDDGLLSDIRTVFTIVVAGNGARIQPVTKPQSAVTLFPRLALHKGLAKSFVVLAESEYESGNSTAATAVLAETIKYGQNITRMGAMYHQALGVTLQQIALRPLWEHRDEISERAASPLPKLAQRGLEFDQARWTMDAVLAESAVRSKSWKDFFVPFFIDADDELESVMPPEEEKQFLAEYAKTSSQLHGRMVAVLSQPETQWQQRANALINQKPDEKEFSGKRFAAMDWGPVPTYLKMIVKNRARMRLLKVVSQLAVFREQHGQFPRSLHDLADTRVVTDPLTGSAFGYHLTADSYELFSAGYGETGRIYLWERREVEFTDPPLS